MKIGVAGYYWLDTWILANDIQLATQDFCKTAANRCSNALLRKVSTPANRFGAAAIIPTASAQGSLKNNKPS